ncbi:MAG TPA: F0F1 ATP synthase subunit delta [Candidatus Nanopelagicaceae bacterium]|nr:F0F1 ATP synthase subunit delta [Candidatus Nanopelagicaceae bacterium]
MPEGAREPRVPSQARHYAQALFELARDKGDFASWQERLRRLGQLLDGSDLGPALLSPQFSAAQREELALAVLTRDPGIDQPASNLLRLLIRSRRTAMLGAIRAGYSALVDQAEGRVQARLATAVAVSPEDLARFGKELSERLGQEVEFQSEVDPSLLGGAVVRVGDRVFDASLKSRLLQLRHQMLTEAQTA